MKMKKLYIDIDGVLLTKRNTRASCGAIEFIDYAIKNFDCYWLTTHCRDGNTDGLLKMLSQYFPQYTLEKLKMIKPTVWSTLKTEAIDFSSAFLWLDDYVFEAEKKVLREKGCLNNLILVNLENAKELQEIMLK